MISFFIEGYLIKFNENRISSNNENVKTFSEDFLLKADAINRLKRNLKYKANYESRIKYLNKLSNFINYEIDSDILKEILMKKFQN